MTNELAVTGATEAFRAVASDRLIAAANMTPHQLLDEAMRLAKVIDASRLNPGPDDYGVRYTAEGNVAIKELGIINEAAKARFGFLIHFQVADADIPF